MAKTQKALLVTKIGEPLVLETNRPVPTPGPDQILLQVTVAGLNPHDQKCRDRGIFIGDSLPAVLAADIVGRAVAVGANVKHIAVGDRIVSQPHFVAPWAHNGLQEYALADVGAFTKIPDAISDDEACTLPTNIIAPLVALFDGLGIPAPWVPEAKTFDYAGTALLIIGGGSACGKFGVQLASLAGIGTIIVVGGNETELRGWGATKVIDRHLAHDQIVAEIRNVVGDELVYAYDAVTLPEEQHLSLNALSNHKRGALARLLRHGTVDDSKVHEKSAGYELVDIFGSSHWRPALCAPFWDRLPGYLEDGRITPLNFVAEKSGLDAGVVNGLLDRYRDDKPISKTHIHI